MPVKNRPEATGPMGSPMQHGPLSAAPGAP
jgi:hypothetical protein